MMTLRYATLSIISLLILLLSFGLMTACNSNDQTISQTFQTTLLATEPQTPLIVNNQYEIRSRTQAPEYAVSHVELYVVEYVPLDEAIANQPGVAPQLPYQDILISSQAAPFNQTIFTASQSFIPKQPGEYLIKVVGYNKIGQSTESQYLRFTAIAGNSTGAS